MRFYLNIIIVLICVSIDMRADGKTDHEYIPFKVYFEMAEAATFKARDMKFSDLPGGVPCAFIYSGPKKPLTHKFFHEMGFRSTVFVGPGESKEKLRALEATGVELALGRYPGAKGNYQSFIGRNTAQEAFDTVAASRIELLSKIKGQLFVASISGHLKSGKWVLQREPYATRTMGFGAVMSDANFRLTYMDKPSVITALLGYKGEDQTSVAYYQQLTSMDTRKIPNEMIYYQILANAFKGATKRVGRGVIVRIQVRDFGKKDLLDIKDQIAEYGSHPNIWHANMGMLLSNQYLQGCIKVLDVKCTGKKGVLTLGIKKDVYGPIIQTPLSLKFPKKVRVTSASAFGMDAKVDSRVSRLANRSYSHVSIAAKKAFHEGLSFEWSFKKKTLTTPDQTEFEVVVRSQLKHALSNIKLHWYAPTGVPIGKKDQHTIIYGKGTVVSGKANKTTLAPGGTLTIKGTLQTHKHSRFGLTPVSLNIEGQLGKTRRLFLNGAEIPVMPLLGVEMHPRKQMPMRKGDVQYFRVKVSNENAFLHPNSASANKGVLRLTPFEGLAIEPKSISFQLKKNESKYFIFKVTNSIWSDQIIRLRPEITLAGSKTPISNLAVGTRIVREQKLIDIKPLDNEGLLVFASYDDLSKNGRFDKATGNPRPYHYPNHTTPYVSYGVKNNCTSASPSCNIYSAYRNVDHRSGTALFWVKRDPVIKNELRIKGDPKKTYKDANSFKYETLFWTPGLQVYRFPDWSDKPGYVQVIYQEAFGDGPYGPRQVITIPYSKKEQYEWTHWAVSWDVKRKHLMVYKNGKQVGAAPATGRPWYAFPWDLGGLSGGWDLIINSMDHGRKCATLRDEVYIYDRPLSANQIMKNMQKAKK